MARRIALFSAWLGATALAVVVASAAVGTVRSEVTDQPAAGEPFAATTLLGDATPISTSTTSAPGSSSTTSSTADADGDAPSTTISSSTTTSTTSPEGDDDDDGPAPTTATTMPAPTTTAPPSITKTYNLAGGTVTIAASAPDVRFIGASPAAGYTIEVEDRGPDQVKVEFDGAGGESKFVAKWDSGELVVEIDSD